MKYGMKGATVRKIAKEAGMSPGSLRHYFPSQGELYQYSLDLVKARVRRRIERILSEKHPLPEAIYRILLQLLPMDRESRMEMEVWFHSLHYFQGKGEPIHDNILPLVEELVKTLKKFHLLNENLDPAEEAERLYAIIDGMALHMLMDPERLTPERAAHLLHSHLQSMIKDEAVSPNLP